MKRSCLSYSALHAVHGRPALALWIHGLNLRDFREDGSPSALSGDERMLEWIVLSVRSGWTPREVLLWIFPIFGGVLFDLDIDVSGTSRCLRCAFIICNASCCSGEIGCLRLRYPFACAVCMCVFFMLCGSGNSVAVVTGMCLQVSLSVLCCFGG